MILENNLRNESPVLALTKKLFRRPKNTLENDGAPAIRAKAPAVPDSLMEACPGCKAMVFADQLAVNAGICPNCGLHHRISPARRIELIADPGSFEAIHDSFTEPNHLDFPGYDAKLARARETSGAAEGVTTGFAAIEGCPCAVFVMDSSFMMGSMGTAVGEKIALLFEEATRRRLPVVGFTVSGGARMQEGILSLMQMAKTSGAVRRHSDAGLLYIAVLTDPTTGGVTASFAMEADITLAEPGALVAFAGPRVIEQTIHQKLPEGFQRSEFLLEHGFVDMIVDRREQRETLARLLRLHEVEARA